jgi:F0F1-type ATP synthase assembly protein I
MDDNRSPFAEGMMWVNRILTASLVLVIPPFVGNWLDGKYQTSPLLLILGALFGLIAAAWHYYKIAVALSKENGEP